MADLPRALQDVNLESVILTDGLAHDHLDAMGIGSTRVSSTQDAVSILKKFNPRVVLVGTASNPDTIGLDLVCCARKRGVPSVGVIDLPVGADRRFRGRSSDPMAYAPDRVGVPDVYTRDQFLAVGFPPERLVVIGHPHYDYIRSVRKRMGPETDTGVISQPRQSIVFATEGSARIATQKGTGGFGLVGRGATAGQRWLWSRFLMLSRNSLTALIWCCVCIPRIVSPTTTPTSMNSIK